MSKLGGLVGGEVRIPNARAYAGKRRVSFVYALSRISESRTHYARNTPWGFSEVSGSNARERAHCHGAKSRVAEQKGPLRFPVVEGESGFSDKYAPARGMSATRQQHAGEVCEPLKGPGGVALT